MLVGRLANGRNGKRAKPVVVVVVVVVGVKAGIWEDRVRDPVHVLVMSAMTSE